MANKQTGGTRLTGLNPLSYMGVEPSSPPQLVRYQRQPTNRDFGFNIGDLWLVEDPFQIWMLVEKPQNVAFWALIYPQAGGAGGISLIHTDAGDVVADVNGEIGIVGGENINVGTSGPNELVVNLNRTIQWPTTAGDGSEGVIYLGGNRFLHGFGSFFGQDDANTFLGNNSGNFTVGGQNNTGIGGDALIDIDTGANNTALGSGALQTIVTGNNNIGIGAVAGSQLNTIDSENICIGNLGVNGDSGVTRIGTEGTQVEAHLAGVFGATVAGTVTPGFVINVDDEGQLGQLELTSSGATIAITQPSNGVINLEAIGGGGGGANPFAFSYVQVGDTGFHAGTFSLGEFVALTQLFDVGNNVFPGDGAGAPAVFTAPVTGTYYLQYDVVPRIANGDFARFDIVTTPRSYTGSTVPNNFVGAAPNAFFVSNSIVVELNMGDTATFTVAATASANVIGTAGLNATRISGFLIPESGTGGSFSQPFSYFQATDTVAAVGNETFELGAKVALTQEFDVGANCFAGDGAGLPFTFTAPETGIYQLDYWVCYSQLSSVSSLSHNSSIVTPTKTFTKNFVNGANNSGAGVGNYADHIGTIVALTAADIVTFESIPRNTIRILGNHAGTGVDSNQYMTRVTGYRIG